MAPAYACEITEDNFGAIRSEKPDFNLEETKAWLEQHGSGFFVREEGNRAFDCKYMEDAIFHQLYIFEAFDPNGIFHRIIRR